MKKKITAKDQADALLYMLQTKGMRGTIDLIKEQSRKEAENDKKRKNGKTGKTDISKN